MVTEVKHLITLTTQLYVWQEDVLYLMRVITEQKRTFQVSFKKKIGLLIIKMANKEINFLATVSDISR